MSFIEKISWLAQYYAAFVAGGVGFATGAAYGWTNGPISLTAPADHKVQTPSEHIGSSPLSTWIWHTHMGFRVTTMEFFLVAASLNLGAIIASIPSGFIIDAIGRKSVLLLLFGPYILGWLIMLAAPNAWVLCVGRSVLGVAAAASSVVGPVYMVEISRKQIRGIVGGFYKLQMTIGILFVYILGTFVSSLSLIIACLLMHFIIFAPMMWLPETPTFLVWCSRHDEARKSLLWLRGKNYDPTAELEEIQAFLTKLKAFKLEPIGFIHSLQRHSSLKALYISLALVSFVQMSGVNLIAMFSSVLFSFAIGGHEPRFSTIILGCVYSLATLISILVADRLGRRLLLLISTASIMLAYIVLGGYFYFEIEILAKKPELDWAPLVCLSFTMCMFSFGLGTVPWILIGELFPPDLKGPAVSIATTVYWLAGILVAVAAVFSNKAFGIGITFWIFALSQFFNLFFIYFLIPETRGKSLNEINEMLSSNKLI